MTSIVSDLKLTIDRSQIQTELFQALHLHLRDQPVIINITEAEGELFSAAFSGSGAQ
jgi:hypothetical protein